MIFSILFLLTLVGTAGYVLVIYSRLVRVSKTIDKAYFNIDIILKQRHDDILKLIKICGQYTQFERETLEKVIALRLSAMQAVTVRDRLNKENQLTKALGGIWAVGEAYPELKSNNNISQLQARISGLEAELKDRREFYNKSVNIFNTRIHQFPDSVVAEITGKNIDKELFRVS